MVLAEAWTAAPEDSDAERSADLGSRCVAAIVDWVVILAASYTILPLLCLLLVRLLGLSYWAYYVSAGPGAVTAYFCFSWLTGLGPGMRAARLTIRRTDGVAKPRFWQVAVRACFIAPLGGSAVALALLAYATVTGQLPSGAEAHPPLRWVAVLIALTGVYGVSSVAARYNPARRAWQDRLSGTIVVHARPGACAVASHADFWTDLRLVFACVLEVVWGHAQTPRLSRWWLGGVIFLIVLALLVVTAIPVLLLEGDTGALVVVALALAACIRGARALQARIR